MLVVGWLASGSPNPNSPSLAAFRQGLSETGCVEGQNVAMEYRDASARSGGVDGLQVGRNREILGNGTGHQRHPAARMWPSLTGCDQGVSRDAAVESAVRWYIEREGDLPPANLDEIEP